MKRLGWLTMVVVVLLAGCDTQPITPQQRNVAPGMVGVDFEVPSSPAPPPPPAAGTASAPAAAPATGVQPPPPPPPPPPAATASAEPAPAAPMPEAAAAPPAQPSTYVVADTGVGKKGDYGPGMITTPVSVYWRSQESVAFRIQIPQAMNLYKATNGQAPQSHDEFMEKIVQANGIKLPELKPGERYLYDPATEQLLVERPAQ